MNMFLLSSTAASLRKGIQMSGATLLSGGLGYGVYMYQTDDATQRAMKAYSILIPVVLHYRYMEARDKYLNNVTSDDWNHLDELYAQSTVRRLGQLQGIYVKYCQTAAGFHNTFSETWIQEFRKLEDQVPPPHPIETVYETIKQETGCNNINDIFDNFDPQPLGSASIGQVHKATLKETGQTVAVKVQYSTAQQLFRHDMKTIRRFCTMFAPEHMVTLQALEKQNELEMNYLEEAHNLQDVRNNMIKHGFMPREVVVPKPFFAWTTRRLLVMEYIQGMKLIDGIRDYFSIWAEQYYGITLEEIEQQARKNIAQGIMPPKYNGPSAWMISWYRFVCHCYNTVLQSTISLCNTCITMTGMEVIISKLSHPKPIHIPPNIPRIIDTLMRVHAYQLFADGIFQADPHGGNFLLLPDGRIGLIDYGATKRLTRNERLSSLVLFAALYRNDEEVLYNLSQVGGYKSKYGRKDILMKLIQFGWDSWGPDVVPKGKNLQQFIDELKKEDPWEEVPDNLVMAQFMSIRLRSLALGMNHPVKCSDYWGPIAEKILRDEENLPYEVWDYNLMSQHKPQLNIQRHIMA